MFGTAGVTTTAQGSSHCTGKLGHCQSDKRPSFHKILPHSALHVQPDKTIYTFGFHYEYTFQFLLWGSLFLSTHCYYLRLHPCLFKEAIIKPTSASQFQHHSRNYDKSIYTLHTYSRIHQNLFFCCFLFFLLNSSSGRFDLPSGIPTLQVCIIEIILHICLYPIVSTTRVDNLK